jgi:hypothetical protein
MQEYRAYVIGPDGRITSRVEFLCEDDEAAQKQAMQLVGGHDVELWQFGRKVATFPHKPVGSPANLD